MTVVPTASAVPESPNVLYDVERAVHYPKPLLRGWLHLVWFALSLITGTLILDRVNGASHIAAVAVYACTVTGLFGISALYHRKTWSPSASRLMQRLDHIMIFFLIAGTATPEFVFATPGIPGQALLAVMWTVTIAAATVHLRWMTAPEKLVGAVFLALGWGGSVALPAVWIRFGVAPFVLLVAGGLLYTLGALSYHRRRPDPSPSIFGYHEVFHAYVCAAATCQYIAIAVFIA
jgi:hemolysin III